jgi:acyl-coenzyme A thioesterase PaaI-like protein
MSSTSPRLARIAFNWWSPFRGAGIRVIHIADDFRSATVEMRLRSSNRSGSGTHFGGSLFAMTDPFFALMMLRNLGPGYVVWDKSGSIAYRKPGRGDVFAHFRLPASAIARARKATAHGARHEPTFRVRIVDRDGETVAEVEKTLHIRRRPAAAAPAARAARPRD